MHVVEVRIGLEDQEAVRVDRDAFVGLAEEGDARLDGDRIAYTLTNVESARVRPRQRSDADPVPVLATPRLARAAGADGLLPLQVGGTRIPVRVAATVERFPGIDGPGVVGDVDALGAALNAERPGSARVGEVWLGVRDDAAADRVDTALGRMPFDVLEVDPAGRSKPRRAAIRSRTGRS